MSAHNTQVSKEPILNSIFRDLGTSSLSQNHRNCSHFLSCENAKDNTALTDIKLYFSPNKVIRKEGKTCIY